MIDLKSKKKVCFGVKIKSDLFDFWLYTGRKKEPQSWDYRECEFQAMVWNKRSNALEWCAAGNRYYAEMNHDVRLEVTLVNVFFD